MTKILWLSPTFNHYKARFLNHLAKETGIELHVLAGSGRKDMGDKEVQGDWAFKLQKLDISKADFGKSPKVREIIKDSFAFYDWILIPAEKKNLPLLLYALMLRNRNPGTQLFSYNHPVLKSGNGKVRFTDIFLTKFFYRFLDRVIFYTEESCKWAVKNNFIDSSKAFFANNTIDTSEVQKCYSFSYPPAEERTIVFLGRLIPSKKLDVLIKYYLLLKAELLKEGKTLSLEVIGDGPENSLLKNMDLSAADIIWHGTLVDEEKIAPIMRRATCVFIPGLSGLSINHSFSYGRPYITLESPGHGPEIAYLENKINGLTLSGIVEKDLSDLKEFLLNESKIRSYCEKALEQGSVLSIEKWVDNMKSALQHE